MHCGDKAVASVLKNRYNGYFFRNLLHKNRRLMGSDLLDSTRVAYKSKPR